MKKIEDPYKPGLTRSDPVYSIIYGVVLVWLALGLVRVVSTKGIVMYLLYTASFIGANIWLHKAAPISFRQLNMSYSIGKSIHTLIILGALVFPILHWLELSGMPVVRAFETKDYLETVLIRQRIYEGANAVWRYGASLNVVAVLPFVLLITLIKRSRWFWPLALYTLVYATSLMQKSYVIVVLLPAAIFALSNKNFGMFAKLAALSSTAIYILLLATNPALRLKTDSIMPSAMASAVEHAHSSVAREAWTAFGPQVDHPKVGKFVPEAFHFNGENAIYLDEKVSRWEIGESDFSVEFWVYPLKQPASGKEATLLWIGSKDSYPGGLHVFYGSYRNGSPFFAVSTFDKSGEFTVTNEHSRNLQLNQWNHVFVGRNGGDLYLGLNGAVNVATGNLANLSSAKSGDIDIVQFGARFGDEYRQSESFFNGYIDEIVFLKETVKYTADYEVPTRPAKMRSVTPSDIVTFESALLAPKSPPIWMSEFLPGWLPSLIHRVLFVPGEVVGHWFEVIPSEVEFANGCGYRPVALMLNCPHVNFSVLVYKIYNKHLVEKGVIGTMNAASFMEDYANFGVIGLLGSGGFLAVLLYSIGVLFARSRKIGVALNMVPVLYLSSSALLPLLLSGGWLVTILLYLIFKTELERRAESDECAV